MHEKRQQQAFPSYAPSRSYCVGGFNNLIAFESAPIIFHNMIRSQCALHVLGSPNDANLSLIGGIESASDMSVQDAVLFAWRGCQDLNCAVAVSKIDVRI
jgi:hypothetical protein